MVEVTMTSFALELVVSSRLLDVAQVVRRSCVPTTACPAIVTDGTVLTPRFTLVVAKLGVWYLKTPLSNRRRGKGDTRADPLWIKRKLGLLACSKVPLSKKRKNETATKNATGTAVAI